MHAIRLHGSLLHISTIVRLMPSKKNGINKRLVGDARYISQLFVVDEREAVLHEATYQKVERVMRQYSSRYVLQEVGPRLWGPWLASSRPEYVLVDTQYPTGPPTGAGMSDMPQAYKPDSFARALTKAGFTGGFESHSLEQGAIDPSIHSTNETPQHRVSTSPWSESVPKTTREGGFVTSTRLLVDGTDTTLPFTLSVPDPTYPARIQLWSVLKRRPEFLELLALLIIWAKSWGMHELTPTVLAYLVFRFIQDITSGRAFSQRQGSKNNSPRHAAFIKKLMDVERFRIEFRGTLFCSPTRDKRAPPEYFIPDPIAQPVQTELRSGTTHAVVQTGKLLVLFFRDQMEKHPTFYLKHKESIASAQAIPRLWSPCQVAEVPAGAPAGKPENVFAQEPRHWSRRAMVCVDPFFPHLNLAEGVSWDTVRSFRHRAWKAYTFLSNRHPLSSIFGPHLSSLRPGLTVQIAGYHSNMRPRGNLKTPPFPSGSPFAYNVGKAQKNSNIDRKRSETIQRVQIAIQNKYGKEYKVELFGSVRYGVCSENSDLDLAVVDEKRMDGFPPAVNLKRLPDIYNVRNLANTLRNAGFKVNRVIPFATVPIVKFIDPETKLHCDINVNDQLGIINSNLIRLYCDLFPPLREMLKKIKAWAKPIGLNDPSGERGEGSTFSSYSLTLMTVGFLQMRGLLPNLQADCHKIENGDGAGVFWIRKRSQRMECDVRYHRSTSWVPPTNLPATQILLLDWFRYWAQEFDYAANEMNIRLGGAVPLGSNKRKLEEVAKKVDAKAQEFPGEEEDDASVGESEIESEEESEVEEEEPAGKGKAKRDKPLKLTIMDPFILNKDCTQGIHTRDIVRFQAECRRALFFATYGSLEDQAFIGEDGIEGQSDDEDIFPKKAKKQKFKAHPQVQQTQEQARPSGAANNARGGRRNPTRGNRSGIARGSSIRTNNSRALESNIVVVGAKR